MNPKLAVAYDEAIDIGGGNAACFDVNTGWVLVDEDCNKVTDEVYYEVRRVMPERIAVRPLNNSNSCAVIDNYGNTIIPVQEGNVTECYHDTIISIYSWEKGYSLFHKDGRLILTSVHDPVFFGKNKSYCVVSKENKKKEIKYGIIQVINNEANIVIAPLYDAIDTHSIKDKGLIKVRLGNKYGLLDSNLQDVTPIIYEFIDKDRDKVTNSLAIVVKNGKSYRLYNNGNMQDVMKIYDEVIDTGKSVELMTARKGDKWFIVNGVYGYKVNSLFGGKIDNEYDSHEDALLAYINRLEEEDKEAVLSKVPCVKIDKDVISYKMAGYWRIFNSNQVLISNDKFENIEDLRKKWGATSV